MCKPKHMSSAAVVWVCKNVKLKVKLWAKLGFVVGAEQYYKTSICVPMIFVERIRNFT